MRTLTKTGTALLTLVLATACGGGSSTAKDTPPSKADATKAAKAINLVKADFSAEFSSSPADNSDDSGALPEDVATCLGISKEDAASHDVVDLSSDDFAKGAPPNGVQLSSEVEVITSKAQAKKDLGVFQSSKASDCLGKSFEKSLKDEIGTGTPGVTLGKVEVEKLSPSTSGTDGAFGFSLLIPVHGPGITINVKTEVRGFLKKHTEVTLVTVSYGTGGDVDSDAIYGKLVTRAKSSAI